MVGWRSTYIHDFPLTPISKRFDIPTHTERPVLDTYRSNVFTGVRRERRSSVSFSAILIRRIKRIWSVRERDTRPTDVPRFKVHDIYVSTCTLVVPDPHTVHVRLSITSTYYIYIHIYTQIYVYICTPPYSGKPCTRPTSIKRARRTR